MAQRHTLDRTGIHGDIRHESTSPEILKNAIFTGERFEVKSRRPDSYKITFQSDDKPIKRKTLPAPIDMECMSLF